MTRPIAAVVAFADNQYGRCGPPDARKDPFTSAASRSPGWPRRLLFELQPVGRLAREGLPGADVLLCDVGPEPEFRGGADRAVDESGRRVDPVPGSSPRKATQPLPSSPLQHPHSTQYSNATPLPDRI